ncbi:MAG TPA: hypothetical protein VE955_09425 [Candidatus Dormibacteraeota bacterium]|nr:hypothetical protein [Candidatus Dormibacteraeota bacterium]
MIEITREPRLSWFTDRTSTVLGGVSALLVLVWLLRGLVGLQQYSTTILLISFSTFLTGRVFKTETAQGSGRAISSFLGNLAVAFFGFIISIWFLGWIATLQNDTFPTILSSNVPSFAIGLVATGLAAYAVSRFSPRHKGGIPTKPAFLVSSGTGPAIEGNRLSVKRDTVGMPIKNEGQPVGCILLGDLSTSFDTPMGPVSAMLPGPVTTVGIPFQGRRLGADEVARMTGKPTRQLLAESGTRAGEVEIEKLKKAKGCRGVAMRVGPLVFDWDEERSKHERWLAKGSGESFVSIDGGSVSAKWNGSSLSLDEGTMKLMIGGDGFYYSPTEIKTISPLHTLQVTQDKITLDTGKFTLKISGDKVVFRTEQKTSATESKQLANDLRKLLTETAKKHVRDVMEGTPIDLSEMFATTQEALTIYE